MSVNECKSKKGENDCERKRKNFELFTFKARKRNTVRMRVCQKARSPFRGTRACAYDRTHVTCKCINAWWNSGLYRFSGVKKETKDIKKRTRWKHSFDPWKRIRVLLQTARGHVRKRKRERSIHTDT